MAYAQKLYPGDVVQLSPLAIRLQKQKLASKFTTVKNVSDEWTPRGIRKMYYVKGLPNVGAWSYELNLITRGRKHLAARGKW